MPERRNTYPRAHRLKRRRLIRPLFERGRSDVGRVSEGVVQIRYRVVPRAETGIGAPIQVGFAPGRRARTSVGRTRLRRLMRETYRLHQHGLRDLFGGRADTLTAMVLFRGREASAAEDLRRDLPEALRRLEDRLRGEGLPPAA
ncbi:MAG: ribonuclease P protein component [Rubricoccaceae bacterium]|nr:ribonuclease P protein component [Rubricoccaceae bacterium]